MRGSIISAWAETCSNAPSAGTASASGSASLQLTTAGTICNRLFLSAPPRRQAKMPFDEHGHILVTPRELERQAFSDPDGLINHQLLPGTPWGFPTYEKYARFIDHLTSQTGIHPHNFLFRGSTKIGFSISPNRKTRKVWRRFGPRSDLDLAIIDTHFFTTFDEQVRRYDRRPENLATILRYRTGDQIRSI